MTVIYASGWTNKLFDNFGLDYKPHTSLTFLINVFENPIKCVTGTNVSKLSFFGKACFTECCDINVVMSQFSCY